MRKTVFIPFAFFLLTQCADLEEEVLDEIQEADIELNESTIDGLTTAVYAELIPNFTERNYFNLQESTSDISITPTRFRADGTTSDWFDGGRYLLLHQHTWDANQPADINTVWTFLQGGIARAIDALSFFDLPDAANVSGINVRRAEVQGLLAFYMWAILDLYGQVPFEDFATGEKSVLTGDDAISEIERLLTSAIPNLPNKASSQSGALFSRGAAKALLARVYLNRAVYIDRYAGEFNFSNTDMQRVITETTDIIDNEGYSLATDYFRLFDGDSDANSATDELIFVVNCVAGQTCNRAFLAMTLSQGQYGADAGSFRGWNGFATLPEFVDSWNETDPRFFEENYPNQPGTLDPDSYQLNRGIQVGQQYGPVPVDENDVPTEGGTFRRDGNDMLVIEELRNFLRDNLPVNYTREITSLENSNQFEGARVFKYEYDTPGPGRWDTDINPPIFRLADIYLMRAEARLRNGDATGALADVNALRDARGASTLNSIDLDGMLAERGFEFYWESHRRTDLIRFGRFDDTWTEKPVSEPFKRVFPIPPNTLAVSDNLTQNEGY